MSTGNREKAPIDRRHFLKASLAAVGSAGALTEALRAAPAEEVGDSQAPANPARDPDGLPMRVGLGQFSELTDERMAFVKQCGVGDIVLNTPKLPGDRRWEYEDLRALHTRAREAGLRLVSIENVPISFYDKIMLGLPGREAQLV